MNPIRSSLALVLLCLIFGFGTQAKDSGPSMHASGRYSQEKLATKMREAEQGDAKAAYGIHQHYMFSNDRVLSIKWLRIAAIMGDAAAQHAMFGILTWKGDKAPLEDRIEARLWLNKAAQAGYESAVEELKRIEEKSKKP